MRRFGCLSLLGRFVVLVIGFAIIGGLGYLLVNKINDNNARAAERQAFLEQQPAYPGMATEIGQENTRLQTKVALTLQPTLIALSSTPATGTAIALVENTTPTEGSAVVEATSTETATSTNTDVPPTTAAPTNTDEPTVAPSETTIPTTLPTDTPVIVPSNTQEPTVVALVATETPAPPTVAPTNTDVPTATNTDIPPSATPEPPTLTFTPTVEPTSTKRAGPPPTNTKRPTAEVTVAPPTATDTATITPIPATNTPTVVPTATFTLTPTDFPTVAATNTLPVVYSRTECTSKPQPTEVPPPAPRLRSNGQDIMNILLIGSDADVNPDGKDFRTDTLLIVSINRTVGSVSMLSLPRDLYVCIPDLGMQRINVAYTWGEAVGWNPGGGFGLLQETILYNTGIPIHYYAKVSLIGFKQIVDTLNGVDIAVDCTIKDELRFTGNYNEQQTPVYEPYTLNTGYYHMDGSLALWYARMRHNTSDFDRNRRQQQVLRAIWRAARDQGLIQKAPELWGQLTSVVTTNMQLQDVIGLIPIGLNLEPGDITNYYMFKGYQTQHWRTPQGEDVQIPSPEGFFQTIHDFYTPPSKNKLGEEASIIEVYNASGNTDWDKVAADSLGWKGFPAQAKGPVAPQPNSVIFDYTGGAKPGTLAAMLKALNLKSNVVVSQPDPNRTVDFRIVLGGDYDSCTAPGFN